MPRRAALAVLIAWLVCVDTARPGGAVAGGDGYRYEAPEAPLHRPGDRYAGEEYDDMRRLRQRGEILPLEQILQQARRERDGRVLETGLFRRRGRYLYEVELVDTDGQVWEMEIDAATGEVLKNRLED